jgi:hypothetical protein
MQEGFSVDRRRLCGAAAAAVAAGPVGLVDKIQRLGPADLANFRRLAGVGSAPSVRFYPLDS